VNQARAKILNLLIASDRAGVAALDAVLGDVMQD
jgi:hypothetical protein